MTQVATALLFPDDVSKAIVDIRVRFGSVRARAVVPHITLMYPFVPKVATDVLRERLEAVAREHAPFSLVLDGFGYFEGENTVAYLAVEDAGSVLALHRSMTDSLADVAEGRLTHFENEGFVPHVTIHDEISKERLASFKTEVAAAEFHCAAAIETFCLFANDGTGWRVVHTFRLSGH